MGLSGAKKKNKISRDPNNNNWSSSTERFGHRMLTSQGWTPGSYLGAKDAAQSEHFTAANASHIRILLKDDNLGLGAKRGAKADTFGLSTLQGIFGRLNGKSDAELVKAEKSQRDAELALYQGQRWGHVQFVSGGFLVGDSIERRSEKAKAADIEDSAAQVEAAVSSKKRKRAEAPLADTSESKRPKKTKLAKAAATDRSSLPSDVALSATPLDDDSPDTTTDPEKQNAGQDLLDKAERKEEKRRRKQEKAQRKAEREARRAAKALKKQKRQAVEDEDTTMSSRLADGKEEPPDRPTESQALVPTKAPFGRHAVRSRYIRQKRMALMDAKALNEILMIKAQG